jgi:CTP:molybdopterin cytidylyltransferase MocA
MTVAGVVLAAGAGDRFTASGGAGHKLLAELDGRALVDHVLDAALGAGLAAVALVDGAVDLRSHARRGVVHLHNPAWAEGLATSLQVGLAWAASAGHDAVVVGLADQPAVPSSAWAAVAAAPIEPPIAVASYAGQRGNPVRLAAAMWPLLPRDGDRGARAVMHERPDLVREVPCSGRAWDVDTREDLERWS